jgi:hypothetical protein
VRYDRVGAKLIFGTNSQLLHTIPLPHDWEKDLKELVSSVNTILKVQGVFFNATYVSDWILHINGGKNKYDTTYWYSLNTFLAHIRCSNNLPLAFVQSCGLFIKFLNTFIHSNLILNNTEACGQQCNNAYQLIGNEVEEAGLPTYELVLSFTVDFLFLKNSVLLRLRFKITLRLFGQKLNFWFLSWDELVLMYFT